jgi:hypothetical protein
MSSHPEGAVVAALDAVEDRESFLEFVRVLAEDRRLASDMEAADARYAQFGGARDWQWGKIEDYLEASCACAEASTEKWFGPEPSWKAFATFLYVGKIYE